jgi:hypothetical protein
MYENIGPVVPPYESVSFGIIEPLNSTVHFVSPLAGSFYSWGGLETNRRHEHELRWSVCKMLCAVNIPVRKKSAPVYFYAAKNVLKRLSNPMADWLTALSLLVLSAYRKKVR